MEPSNLYDATSRTLTGQEGKLADEIYERDPSISKGSALRAAETVGDRYELTEKAKEALFVGGPLHGEQKLVANKADTYLYAEDRPSVWDIKPREHVYRRTLLGTRTGPAVLYVYEDVR